MALPEVYRPKVVPLGLEFHSLRPDIDPKNTLLVEMVYDVKKGTETGLREFLYPATKHTTICLTQRPGPSAPTFCCWAN